MHSSDLKELMDEKSLFEMEPLQAIHFLTSNPQEIQLQLLSSILHSNSDTEYLRRHGMDGKSDKKSFKTCLPLITYKDIKPYIDRIANGDASPILSSQPISEFLASSGTSAGERKLIPFVAEELNRRHFFMNLVLPIMHQYVGGLFEGKGFYLQFIKSETKTTSGLVARPALTSFYKSAQFLAGYDSDKTYTSPMEAILCLDVYQSMYCQLICGLIQSSQVLRIGTTSATIILRAITFLQKHWKDICHDIAHGELKENITDPSLREAVSKVLHPYPSLAQHVEQECSKPSWEGIIKSLWPNAKFIEAIYTGTMAQYIPMLDYYSGGLPLSSPFYASSECYFALNLKPLCKPSEVSYAFMPNMGYFEFLPVKRSVDSADNQKEEDTILDLADVNVGEEYELVVTTYCGLYRYKMGDILRCSGFYNKTPQFQFICRKNVLLSIDVDKTDEECLYKAVRNAADHLEVKGGSRLIDYTSYADTSTNPGHYVLFWEIQSLNNNNNGAAHCEVKPELLEECCLIVEESLDSVYRQCRSYLGSIGALEIRLVESGTFEQLMDYSVKKGSAFNQYKTPRCITLKPLLELLDSKVASRYCSLKLPFWSHERSQC